MEPCRNSPGDYCDYFWPRQWPRTVTVNCTFIAPLELRIEWQYFLKIREAGSIYTEKNAGEHHVTNLVTPCHTCGNNSYYHTSFIVIGDGGYEDAQLLKNSSIVCSGFIHDDKVSELSMRVGLQLSVPWCSKREVIETENVYLQCDPENIPSDKTEEVKLLKYNELSRTYDTLAVASTTKPCQLIQISENRYSCDLATPTPGLLKVVIKHVKLGDSGRYVCSGRIHDTPVQSPVFSINVIIKPRVVAFTMKPCESKESMQCTHTILTCTVHGSENVLIEWTFAVSDRFSVLQKLTVINTFREVIDERHVRHEQVATIENKYRIYKPSCMVGNTKQETELAEKPILEKPKIKDHSPIKIKCSSDIFGIGLEDLESLQITKMSPEKYVVATYAPSQNPQLKCNFTAMHPWICDFASEGFSAMKLTASLTEARCPHTGWYQCSAKSKSSQHDHDNMDVLDKVTMEGTDGDEMTSSVHVKNCVRMIRNGCEVKEGDTFHINCSAFGPHDINIKWHFNITDYPYQTRETHRSFKVGSGNKYCLQHYHESILTVYLASLQESVTYTCQVFVNNTHDHDKWVKIEVKPKESKVRDKIKVKENGTISIQCTAAMFSVSANDVEYLQISKSTAPVKTLVTYRPGEYPSEKDIPKNRHWEIKYNSGTLVLVINNAQCSDNGWYRCTAKSRGTTTPVMVIRFEIVVTGFYDTIREQKLDMPRCRNLKYCLIQNLPDHKYKLGCLAIGPRNLHVQLSVQGTFLNLKDRRTQLVENQYCPLFYHQKHTQVEPLRLIVYRCEFTLNPDKPVQYEEITIEQDNRTVESKADVMSYMNDDFSVACSRINAQSERGELRVLEIYKSKMSATLLTEEKILSHTIGQHKPDYIAKPEGRLPSAEIRNEGRVSINFTMTDAKCGDSGYYFCCARTENLEKPYQVVTDIVYVYVTEIGKPHVRVTNCQRGGYCEIEEGQPFEIICSLTYGNIYKQAVDIHWFHEIDENAINISVTSAYQTTKSVTVALERNETFYCKSEKLLKIESAILVEFSSSTDPDVYVCESTFNSKILKREKVKVYVKETVYIFPTAIFLSLSLIILLAVVATVFFVLRTIYASTGHHHRTKKDNTDATSASYTASSGTASGVSSSTIGTSDVSNFSDFGVPSMNHQQALVPRASVNAPEDLNLRASMTIPNPFGVRRSVNFPDDPNFQASKTAPDPPGARRSIVNNPDTVAEP